LNNRFSCSKYCIIINEIEEMDGWVDTFYNVHQIGRNSNETHTHDWYYTDN